MNPFSGIPRVEHGAAQVPYFMPKSVIATVNEQLKQSAEEIAKSISRADIGLDMSIRGAMQSLQGGEDDWPEWMVHLILWLPAPPRFEAVE